MTYKLKAGILACINAVLVLIIILGVVFDPQRSRSRSDMYSWLERGKINEIEKIRIINSDFDINLVREESDWFVVTDGIKLPAGKLMIDDFINALSGSGVYSVFSTSAESHERLLLTDDTSIRIILTGKDEQPLLDMHVGLTDVTGRNVFLRKQGHPEVRSGEDIFSVYAASDLHSWYNLFLIPETETGYIDVSSVSSLTVHPPAGHGTEPLIFTGRGGVWNFNLYISNPDMGKVDSYIQEVLRTSGDDFAVYQNPAGLDLDDSRIIFEFADNSVRTISLGPVLDNGKRYASVSNSGLVYTLPEWVWQRLFPDISVFSWD